MFSILENGVLKMIIDADDYKVDLTNSDTPVLVFFKGGMEGALCDEGEDESTPYIDWIPKGKREKVKEERVKEKKKRVEKEEKDNKDHKDKVEKEKKEKKEKEEKEKKDKDDKEKKEKEGKDKKDKK